MAAVPLEHGLLVALGLFALGLVGVLMRRNLLYVLISIEIMLNAAALAFIVGGAAWGEPQGHVMFLVILSVAGAEVSVGLALAMLAQKHFRTLDAGRLKTSEGDE
jgi:NADH-quinone oxidoreductase subunit K